MKLSIISVNIWQILISFANLALLTWIVSKFLFKPVKKVLDARRENIDSAYARANEAEAQAEEHRKNYEAAMAANKARIPLAKMAIEETGMGVMEDKVFEMDELAVDPQRGAGVGEVLPFEEAGADGTELAA